MTKVTAKDIASIWVHNPPGLKRNFIKDIIVSIYNEVPSTEEYKSAQLRLSSILDSLWYRAPEVLNNSWMDVFKFLELYLILDADMSKNPQWLKNIIAIWEKGNEKLVSDFKDE